jgi:hypothetical protein
MSLNESIVEDAALEWFGELGYSVGHGPHFRQFRTLARLRDTLLPKLLSGELSVGAGESTIATVP